MAEPSCPKCGRNAHRAVIVMCAGGEFCYGHASINERHLSYLRCECGCILFPTLDASGKAPYYG